MKKLIRPREGKMIVGVCAAIANYFGMDATVVRVIWAIVSCFVPIGLLAYFICAVVIPEDKDIIDV